MALSFFIDFAWFGDFRMHEEKIRLFATPFIVNPEDMPTESQMEIIELQCNALLEKSFDDCTAQTKYNLLSFYRSYLPENDFPWLRKHARIMVAQFASLYLCESVFSQMKIAKSKYRSVLTDAHLQATLRLATSAINPDIPKLAKVKQFHRK